MNMFNSSEDFERMTKNLNINREPPPGHRQELRLRMLAAFAESQAQESRKGLLAGWRVRLKGISPMRNWIIRAAAAIVIVGIVGVGMYWLKGTQSIAFADVVRAVLDTRTVTFKMTSSGKINGQEVPGQNFDVVFMDPGRQRLTSAESVMIVDAAQDKFLTLLPKSKLAMVMTATNKPKEPQAGNMFEHLRGRLEKFQSGQKENIVELGKKTISGRTAIGYHLGEGGFPLTIWADAETKLPLIIEMEMALSDGAVTTSMTDFAWGVPVDEKLFSMEIPKDYTVQESHLDMSNLTEKDVIQMLRTYSSLMDGDFPSKVDMPAYFDLMKPLTRLMVEKKGKSLKDLGRVPTTQEITAFQEPLFKAVRGIKFVMTLPSASDWHYFGKDVAFNAPNTPIAWYRPEKSKTYRVIYADLHTEDAQTPPAQPTTNPTYASQPSQVVDFKAREDELIKYLRMMAGRMGGDFPKSLIYTPELVKQMEEHPKTRESSVEEKNEFVRLFQRAEMHQTKLMRNGEFVYASEGVKLGDKATPILWYRLKGSKTYRIIYGDLHVEDAQTPPAQPATNPAAATRPSQRP